MTLPCKSLYMFDQHIINYQGSSFIKLIERTELNVLVEDILNITKQLLYPEKTRLSQVIETNTKETRSRQDQ